MKKVEKFEAVDGKLFDTEKGAILHEQFLELSNWYEENRMVAGYAGAYVHWEDLFEWVRRNKRVVKEILQLSHDTCVIR